MLDVKPPGVFVKQGTDETLGLIRDLLKALLIKLPLGSCDQGQGLCVIVTLEGRLTTQSEEEQRAVLLQRLFQHTSTRWH